MRRACVVLGSLVLVSCSNGGRPEAVDGPLGAAESAIAYGSADTTHTAVVSLLIPETGGYGECTGTVVQVKNGVGYVLTAAHCCGGLPQDPNAPTVVVVGSNYSAGVNAVMGGAVNPPAYAVTPGSVYWDDKYNQQQYDFCMLKFAAPAGQAVIPVAAPTDGMSLGVEVEHVGFGVTDSSTGNTVRRTGTAPVNQGLDTWTMTSSQGGNSHIPGVCEGDSGGPGLVPAGAAQSQQFVVATTSYGNSSTCSQNTVNVCMRVTSESGPGGFIANFLADTPSGTQAGSAAADCQTCAQNSENGTCSSQANTCANDPACLNLNNCLQNCTTQACVNTCESTAGNTAVGELQAFDDCVCNTACTTQCASECMGSTSSSSSTSSTSSTSSSSSTSSTSSTSSSSGSSGNPSGGTGGSTASGGMGGGAGTGGTGVGVVGGPGQSSGCSVAEGSTTSSASLAGILLGAALAFSRRRPRRERSSA